MTPRVDKHEEGIKELASMIAVAYLRRATDKTVEPLTASKSDEENIISETEIMASIEPADSHTRYLYTETVMINLMRRKVPRLRTQESVEEPEDRLRVTRMEARNGITECQKPQFSGPNTRMY